MHFVLLTFCFVDDKHGWPVSSSRSPVTRREKETERERREKRERERERESRFAQSAQSAQSCCSVPFCISTNVQKIVARLRKGFVSRILCVNGEIVNSGGRKSFQRLTSALYMHEEFSVILVCRTTSVDANKKKIYICCSHLFLYLVCITGLFAR